MSNTRKNMRGGVARPKRFLRRHYSSRRPSGLQGISTGRKSLFSSRNTRTKADKHFGHKLFGKYASSRKSTVKNVSMTNGVKIKRSSARAPKGSKASKASKSKASKASKANASLVNNFVRYAPSAANELAAVEAAKHSSRVAEQSSARASRAMRGREGRHMNNGSASAAASSSARSEAIRSGKRMSLAAIRRELSAVAASHSGHAAAASGPRDPRDLLGSQDSQE
jgi:hypothetical protein